MPEVEIFTPTGVLSGTMSLAPLVRDGADLRSRIPVDDGRWYPLAGGVAELRGPTSLSADDLLAVVVAAPAMTVHASWFALDLEASPYRIAGRMATPPGFDPARALARPSGPFVALHEVTIVLADRPEAAIVERPYALINRYAVERVVSTVMLGFFFPGAVHEFPGGTPETAQAAPVA